MERRIQSLPLAAVAPAVGAKDAVCLAFVECSLWVGDFPSASVGLSPVERRMQSLPLAAVALAVGARGTVCPP